MTESSAPSTGQGWQVGPAIAAWLLPGLGHILLGEKRRGLIILITIGALFISGLLVGGIDVIDHREDWLWFVGQSMAGPTTLAINIWHQNLKGRLQAQVQRSQGRPDSSLVYTKSLGRVNELGTLYCALAGLLNLLVIVDVAYRPAPVSSEPNQAPIRGRVVSRKEEA